MFAKTMSAQSIPVNLCIHLWILESNENKTCLLTTPRVNEKFCDFFSRRKKKEKRKKEKKKKRNAQRIKWHSMYTMKLTLPHQTPNISQPQD